MLSFTFTVLQLLLLLLLPAGVYVIAYQTHQAVWGKDKYAHGDSSQTVYADHLETAMR